MEWFWKENQLVVELWLGCLHREDSRETFAEILARWGEALDEIILLGVAVDGSRQGCSEA